MALATVLRLGKKWHRKGVLLRDKNKYNHKKVVVFIDQKIPASADGTSEISIGEQETFSIRKQKKESLEGTPGHC